MPIAAQCGGCAARYKIIETAAGRRVRCRRCGKPFMVPGAAPAQAAVDLNALAELEHRGTVIETPETAIEQYKSALAAVSVSQQSSASSEKKKEKGRSYADLAVGATDRRAAAAKEARRLQNVAAISDGMPFPIGGIIGIGVVCVALLVTGIVMTSASVFTFAILTGSFILFYLWAAIEARAVIREQDMLVILLWRFIPIYRAYFLVTRWREMMKSMVLHVIAIGIGVLALISFVVAAPRLHEMGWFEGGGGGGFANSGGPGGSNRQVAAAPLFGSRKPTQKLNDMGEVDDPNDQPPPGWPEGKPWVKHRSGPAGVRPSLANVVQYASKIDKTLKPPPGFKEELDTQICDTIRKNGCIIHKGGKLVEASIVDFGTKTVFFDESNGTYTPSPNGKITAKSLRLTCRMNSGEGGMRGFVPEKDVPDITGPITPEPGQDLQAAIYAKQWKDALKIFEGFDYPSFDKQWLLDGQTLVYTQEDGSGPPSRIPNFAGAAPAKGAAPANSAPAPKQ